MIDSHCSFHRFFIFFLLCAMATSAPVYPAEEESRIEEKEGRALADGTYEGYCRRALGMADVKVTIRDGKIAGIDIVSRFCSPWGRKAFEEMPGRMLEAQSTKVEAVTGATYSSSTIKAAVEDALKKAEDAGRAGG